MTISSGLSDPAAAAARSVATPAVQSRTRMIAIDALRGFVMLCMLVDHVRETFFLHRQVTDPMDAFTGPRGFEE